MSNTQAIGGSSSSGGGGIQTLTPDIGGAVSPISNNINLLGSANIITQTTAPGEIEVILDDPILLSDGSESAPSYSFASGANTGFYNRSGTDPAVTRNGSDVMRWGFTISTFNILETFNGLTYSRQTVNSTPTNISPSAIFVSVDTSTLAITVRLPNSPRENQIFYVKDLSGNAAVNNITVTTVSGAINIDGATTFVMGVNYQSAGFLWNSTSYEVF